MELFYAHYPSLEKEFVRYLLARRQNPLEPWCVVCASSLLARRLGAVLAREQGTVANIHFITAGALVTKLDSEAGPGLPAFPQHHLRDFLLKEILAEPGLDRYPVSRGFVQTLKASLRDLADSQADPEVLQEHLQTSTDPLLTQDQQRLAWLLGVYRRYIEREAQMPGYRPYQALFERALAQVEVSPFLRSMKQLVWYGFYDMSGRQLELFNQVKAHYALSVFAPYLKHPAYRFAQKFFETNWLSSGGGTLVQTADFGALGPSAEHLFATRGTHPARQVKIVPAADVPSEVFFVAKEILNLVETQGMHFADIAVLTRSQAAYQDEVRRIFAQNCIALDAAFSYPLHHFALGNFCLNLFSLATDGFARETVLAVVSSPYFKQAKKHTWRALAARTPASRDLNQWRDLLPQSENFDPDFLTWLETVAARLAALDEPCPWQVQVARALEFLRENVDETCLQGKEIEIFQTVCSQIESLAGFAALRPQTRAGEFVRELADALKALCFNEAQNTPGGVTFTDVLRSRGLRFKVVFLVGMNEKSFPQPVPEDPVLRDRYRYLLRDVLGYWLNQKAERADEERLLFFTACTAAEERIYASYARTGADGKEAVPSVYLAELARAGELAWSAGQAAQVSGRLGERLAQVPVTFLTPKEISYTLVLDPSTAAGNYQICGLFTPEKERALQAAQELAQWGGAGERDGFIQSGAEVFARTEQKEGFSASALQELAACPMKYFFDKVLHLGEPEEPLSRQELSPDARGNAYHEVLQDFYTELNHQGLTHQLFDTGAVQYITRALARRYNAASYRRFGIYPLVWEMILEDMQAHLAAFVGEDLKQQGPFAPQFFEQAFRGLKKTGLPFSLRGVIDRIDVNGADKTFRVVDYKSTKKGGSNLAEAFFTHLIFQPVLYVLAAQEIAKLKGYSFAGSCLLSIHPGYARRELSPGGFAALWPRAEAFLVSLAEGVKRGAFFLSPSELCAYCPYSAICRRDSFSCLMRARKSAPSRQREELRYGKP